MKNMKLSFKYVVKNFYLVFLFALIPAVFAGVFLQPFSLSKFVVDYKTTSINSWGSLLELIVGLKFSRTLLYIFSLILIVVFVSAFLGVIENHFRSGKVKISSLSSFINNNFLAITAYLFIIVFAFTFYKFLLSILMFAFHVIFSGVNVVPNLFTYIINILLLTGSFFVFCYLLSVILLAIPTTLSTGYSIRTSFSNASELMARKHNKTVLSVFLPLIFIFGFSILSYAFNFVALSNIVLLIFILTYYSVLSFTTYYEYSFLNRYDNKSKYYFKQ